MKKFFTLALAAVIAISANAQKSTTPEFTSVKVNVPVHLVIMPGKEYSVNMVSKNQELASAVSWTVKDGTLSLSTRDIDSFDDSSAPVYAIVTSPNAVEHSVGKDMKQVSVRKHKLGRRR
ncbi:MAG: hypothetical protein Q4F47_01010 [Bacteroidaceae bacterium]|nr:hypothetical protein [Bacteroidaceae bacterium]